MKTKPRKFQCKGVRKIRHFKGRTLLADDMGLGKSLQSLLYTYEDQLWPVVIVCDASLKWNWENEAKQHLGMMSEVLEGRTIPKNKRPGRAKIIIVNHDILKNWLPYLRKLKPRCVIADEVQRFKNRKAQRTKAFRQLVRRVKHVLGLSGTPLENRPIELFPFINILRPDVFPSFFRYASRYCNPKRKPWGMDYSGASNLLELNQLLLRTCMVRRRKIDVIKDLPSKTHNVVLLEIEDRKQYTLAQDEFLTWLSKSGKSRTKVLKARKAQHLVKRGYLRRLVADLKLKSVCTWIDSFLESSDEKIILFTYHKKILKELVMRYKKHSVYIDGSVKGRKRQLAIDQFNRNKRVRLMFGQINAAGVGWSAKCCANVGFVEFGDTSAQHGQGIDRVHGIGRGHGNRGVMAYYFVAARTIEEKLAQIIQTKQGILDAVLDGKDQKQSTLNLYDELEKELLKQRRKK